MDHPLSRDQAELIRSHVLELGFDTCGFAPAGAAPNLDFFERWIGRGFAAEMEFLSRSVPLRADATALLPTAKTAIVVTLGYYQESKRPDQEGKIARYALGRDYHRVLRSKLHRLAKELTLEYPDSEFRACVDSAPIFERDLAQRAGLGWFGKNTMLIDSRRGSWFFIGVLLTSLALPYDVPAEGGCGTCRACIDACPTGAIVFADGRWQIDSRVCISYQTIESSAPDLAGVPGREAGWLFGCDICQEVCPFNRPRESQPLRARTTNEPDFSERDYPGLDLLLELSEEDWSSMTQGSAVRRAGYSGLKRNARWLKRA